mmetsp:Transcript_11804/g.34083  ORF Transcript_11804/g.34083 Transcript_11804/m.34083 type:complete len:143 (-) Transcript_11804:871-1299(-)
MFPHLGNRRSLGGEREGHHVSSKLLPPLHHHHHHHNNNNNNNNQQQTHTHSTRVQSPRARGASTSPVATITIHHHSHTPHPHTPRHRALPPPTFSEQSGVASGSVVGALGYLNVTLPLSTALVVAPLPPLAHGLRETFLRTG